MTGLRLVNHSEWSSIELRRFITAGLDHLGASRRKTVTVGPMRGHAIGRGTLGCWYGTEERGNRHFVEGSSIWLEPPAIWKDDAGVRTRREEMEECQRLWLAGILAHEVAHNLGLNHGEMDCKADSDESRIGWARALRVRAKPAKAAPTPEERRARMVERNEAHARARLAKWERRLALAKTKVRKARAAVARYEKKAAAKVQP